MHVSRLLSHIISPRLWSSGDGFYRAILSGISGSARRCRDDTYRGSFFYKIIEVVMYSLSCSCKLNGIEPEAWLRHMISVINTWPANRVKEVFLWNVNLFVN